MSLAACYRLVMFLFMLPSMSLAMRVISTDQDRVLPREGQAEIVSSSLAKYTSFTICARVLTFQFSTHPQAEPLQSILRIGNTRLLGSYVAWPGPGPPGWAALWRLY